MKKIEITIRSILVFIILTVYFLFSNTVWAADYLVKQITNDSALQLFPDISGSKIVWQDNRNGNWDIYMYDYQTGVEKQITSNPAHQERPNIDGSRIVWVDKRNGNGDIYMLDLITGKETVITQSPKDEVFPIISGDWVMWAVTPDWGSLYQERHLYSLTTGKELVFYNTGGGADIEDNQLVWCDDNIFYWSNIKHLNLVTGEVRDITDDRHTSPSRNVRRKPSISGKNIVWTQYSTYNYVSHNPSIILYNLETKKTKIIGDGENARIDNDIIVYENYEKQSIVLYKISTGETFNLALNLTSGYKYPAIDGEVIVWQNNDIYMAAPGVIDIAPPTTIIRVNGSLGQNNWFTSDVQLTLTAIDNQGGSGVAKTEYSFDGITWTTYTAPFTITAEGTTMVYFRSTDKAGNIEPTKEQLIKIDKTPPAITGAATTSPNINGWYNTDVTVHFKASDTVSGVDTITPDITISTDGAGQSVTGTATDQAGNSATFTVTGINIDKTPPKVTITTPAEGKEYILNEKLIADWYAVDELSGLDLATGTVISGGAVDTSSVGSKTFIVTATDKAGNQVTQTPAYYVRYVFSGVLPPVNRDGSSVFKFGSTVPVKFRLQDVNGNYVADAVAKLYVAKVENGLVGTETEAVSTSAATTGNLFRYDDSGSQYIFNLGTKRLSTGTWQLRIELDDGSSKYVTITLK